MKIGIPKEIKAQECRVAITPAGVSELARYGHQIIIEDQAGQESGFANADYQAAGAQILSTAKEIYDQSELIVKVKEPLPEEYDLLKEGQTLFTFLHLAANRELTELLLKKQVTGIAYETIKEADGSLPLLTPMSEVAGRMSIQIASHLLERSHGGRGILMGGVPGTRPAKVLILGGGIVGSNAAKIALGLRADVTIMDISLNRLRWLNDIYSESLTTLYSNPYTISEQLKDTDVLIGAVLIPGAKAPCLVTEEMVKTMKPGSVIVDVAIDQGGSIETIDHATTHKDPVYIKHGVLHYSVANIPGAVPRTSTVALTNATINYILQIANTQQIEQIIQTKPALKQGLNTYQGQIVHQSVAEAFDLPYHAL